MKRFFIPAVLCIIMMVVTTGCKKQIDQLKADAIVDVMVKGKWAIREYLEGPTDITSNFTDYRFQFFRDNTVTAFVGTTVVQNGTWNGSNSTPVITITFSNATAPLSKLNGTWTAYSYDNNGPKFNQTINGVEMKLSLR
jgi:hypothetical protein